MKKISCGQIKEYVKTHEVIKGYDELRNEVLKMALHIKIENNKSTQAPLPMDVNGV